MGGQISRPLPRSASGRIFCLCCNYEATAVRELIESNIPVVGYESPYTNRPCVESKNYEASKKLTEHLIENGHREIVFIAGADVAITRDRIAGYRAALTAHDIPVDEERILHTGFFSHDHGALATQALLSCRKSFTAAMYPDDFTAVAAYRDLAKAGLYVGQNISVTGFDGVSIGRMVSPRLTTIRQDAVRLGQCAADLLIRPHRGQGDCTAARPPGRRIAPRRQRLQDNGRLTLCGRGQSAFVHGAKSSIVKAREYNAFVLLWEVDRRFFGFKGRTRPKDRTASEGHTAQRAADRLSDGSKSQDSATKALPYGGAFVISEKNLCNLQKNRKKFFPKLLTEVGIRVIVCM